MKHEPIEILRTKDAEAMIARDLDNWLRWGRRKDYLPRSFRCPLGRMYVGGSPDNISERPLPIDDLAAVAFEGHVIALEWKARMAFVMYHVGRAAVNGRIVRAKNRADIWNLIGVGERRYQQLLKQAHNTLYRKLNAVGAVAEKPRASENKFDAISLLA